MTEPHKGYTISITSGTIVKFLLWSVLLVALYYLSDVVLVVVAAVVIASAIEPIIKRLQSHKVGRVAGTVIVYAIVIAVLAAILVFVVPILINEAINFLNTIPRTITLGDLWSPLGDSGSSIADKTFSLSQIINQFKESLSEAGGGAFRAASIFFGGFFSFVLIMVLSFYFSVRDGGVDDFLKIITPVRHQDYIIDLWHRSQLKIGYWLQGQIILGIIIGVLVYVTLIVVGIPHALILAILAGLLEIIPIFGPIISAVPAALIAFVDKGVGFGFLIIGLYVIINQFENHLFYPLVVRKIVGISPIVVIISMIVGAKLAGILGILIAVPLSAAFMEYVSDVEKRKKVEKSVSPS